MKCPYCETERTRVIATDHDVRGVRRRRECADCGQRFTTLERAIQVTPLVVKRDGRREEFDRDKLLSGLRIACTRRPVSTDDLERLADRVEDRVQQTGRAEVPSRMIGDSVIAELRELDPVSYIRYAIVYLGLEDLEAVRTEINQLLEGNGE
jgi:transcriptional repressor NrdR